MSFDSASWNPYESPSAAGGQPVVLVRRGLAKISSRVEADSMLYRRVLIEGPIRACVEFHGRSLRDRVFVDGQLVASRISWWRITPRFEFMVLVDDEPQSMVLELRVGPLLRLRKLRILLAGQVIHQEGLWQDE